MRWYSRIAAVVMMLCLVMSAPGFAEPRQEYEEAYKIRLAAAACLAAYSDRPGRLTYSYLKEDGWEIAPFRQTSQTADARFLLAHNQADALDEEVFLLAIVGTETVKDVKTDLKVRKVYFAGHTLEEFAANAELEKVPETEPKVHRGFHQYVQAALSTTIADGTNGPQKYLAQLLTENRSRKVLITGHSLGGAAATVAGAQLISMGVSPDQIEIITFGAPAVGNRAFARQFEPLLDVTRVVLNGDVVTGVLQRLVGGYQQFGRVVSLKMDNVADKDAHSVTEYLDVAIKKYYDKRQQAELAGAIALPQTAAAEPGLLVADIRNSLPEELQGEFGYMEQVLRDEYSSDMLTGALAKGSQEPSQTGAGSPAWHVVAEISGYKLKNEPESYYILLQQVVYDAAGKPVHMAAFSTDTDNLSPLEAFIHAARSARNDFAQWLIDRP